MHKYVAGCVLGPKGEKHSVLEQKHNYGAVLITISHALQSMHQFNPFTGPKVILN